MRISTILRSGVLGVALGAVIGFVGPAFAETVYIYPSDQAPDMGYTQFQAKPYTAWQNAWPHQHANTGVYEGPNWDAARDAPNDGG
ncbi:MAG TPA: hypothetical protein VJR47_12660 [Stellaceae bacterium]|nr:hypothetical protein [Stellaceae bacterium]